MNKTPVTSDISGQLVFLGTGTSSGVPVIGCGCSTCTDSDPRNSRMRCSIALGLPGGNLLVDTPPDLRSQLLREGLGLIHATLYTHEHADHLFGLDDLRTFYHHQKRPMPVYCEASVERRIRQSFDYAFFEEARNYGGGVPQLEISSITTEPFSILSQTIIPIRLHHGRFQVLGFRFGNIAYCTDTCEIPPESMSLLEGLDVLILDALRGKPHPTHFSLAEAIAVAERLAPKRVIFTHMSHNLEHRATNARLPAGMELAYDGMRVPLT